MSELSHVSVTITGHVQGVYYRAFTSRVAKALGLRGYVHNLPPQMHAVEVVAEGDKEKLEELLRQLEVGPPEALVEKIEANWSDFTGEHARFEIRE